MAIDIESETPPLRVENDGAIRIGSSRVLLEIVIRAFQDGATAETISQQYPTVDLADVYAVIAYYLRHHATVNRYLEQREEQSQLVRAEVDAPQRDLAGFRHTLVGSRPRMRP